MGGGGGGEGAGGDLNDASLIRVRALSLYYFILVFWPSRILHSYIIYRNVSHLLHLQNNI